MVHTIGESFGGGIVFYVYDGGRHGLIVSIADQGQVQWFNGTNRFTGTAFTGTGTGFGVNAGAMNTALIVSTQISDNQGGNFAAKLCADYSVTVAGVTYGDWYLPSLEELYLLNQNSYVAHFRDSRGFFDDFYWSSTEFNSSDAWYVDFTYYGWFELDQFKGSKSMSAWVRAIRAF